MDEFYPLKKQAEAYLANGDDDRAVQTFIQAINLYNHTPIQTTHERDLLVNAHLQLGVLYQSLNCEVLALKERKKADLILSGWNESEAQAFVQHNPLKKPNSRLSQKNIFTSISSIKTISFVTPPQPKR